MPVSNEDREAIKKLDASAKDNAVQEQLKRIREGCTGPGSVDHVAMNDALDRIAALHDEKNQKSNPSSRPGGLGGPSQNPSPAGTVTRPYDPSLPANPQVPA